MEETNLKFGITCAPIDNGMWSICIGLSHAWKETYLYLNLFKVSISIGRFYH